MEPILTTFQGMWLYRISVHPIDAIMPIDFYFLTRCMADKFIEQYSSRHSKDFWTKVKKSWRGYNGDVLIKIARSFPDYLRIAKV